MGINYTVEGETTADSASIRELYVKVEYLQREIEHLRKQIAGKFHSKELPQGEFPLLICRVEEQYVAFPLELVVEVVMMAKCTRVPETSPWMQGLLNLRGLSVPVLDIQACFNRRERKPQLSDFVVICRFRGRKIGLVVQEVITTRQFNADDFEKATQDIRHAQYLLGIIHAEDKPVLVVSVQQLVVMSEFFKEKE